MKHIIIVMVAVLTVFALAARLQAQRQRESAVAQAVAHNSWASAAPIPKPYAYTTTALLEVEGKIYVVGGYTGGYLTGHSVEDVQIYDPATNTWSAGVPLPTPLWGASAAAANGILYIFGGTTPPPDLQQLNTVWAFNPSKAKWSAKAPMPTARSSAGTAVKDGIIYVVGGYDGGARLDTVESYDPKTDSWTEESPLLAGRSQLFKSVHYTHSDLVRAYASTPMSGPFRARLARESAVSSLRLGQMLNFFSNMQACPPWNSICETLNPDGGAGDKSIANQCG